MSARAVWVDLMRQARSVTREEASLKDMLVFEHSLRGVRGDSFPLTFRTAVLASEAFLLLARGFCSTATSDLRAVYGPPLREVAGALDHLMDLERINASWRSRRMQGERDDD